MADKLTKIANTDFRNKVDRVCIHCETFDDFNEVKKVFKLDFQKANVWDKYKDKTGIDLSFQPMGKRYAMIYPNYGNVEGRYKTDGYKIIPAKEILKEGVYVNDSGYNFMLCKLFIDLAERVETLEKKLEQGNRRD